MIDFHCHFLPGIDDGASDAAESAEILNRLKNQQVHTVVATPHYIPDTEDIESFLSRREAAYEKVQGIVPDGMRILRGAEVHISPELLECNGIGKLCTENSSCILLEMPYSVWQQWMFDVVFKVQADGITPVIAHAERYCESLNLFKYKRFFEYENIYMQFNAESFLTMSGRRVVKAFADRDVSMILGSEIGRAHV